MLLFKYLYGKKVAYYKYSEGNIGFDNKNINLILYVSNLLVKIFKWAYRWSMSMKYYLNQYYEKLNGRVYSMHQLVIMYAYQSLLITIHLIFQLIIY